MPDDFSSRFAAGRARWLAHLGELIVPGWVKELFADSDLTTTEIAMLTIHVGIGHIYGFADRDSTIPGTMNDAQVVRLISSYWRMGALNPRLASAMPLLWVSLYLMGRDTGTIRPELLKQLSQSQLGRKQRTETERNLDWDHQEDAISDVLSEFAALPKLELDLPLDGPGSHLPITAGLIAALGTDDALWLMTPLEFSASWPDDAADREDLAALHEASRYLYAPKAMPGGWPGPEPTDVPDWVHDVVLTFGARMFYASTGFVPSWLVVADNEDEFQGLLRWTYNPIYGFGGSSEGAVFSIPVDFPSGGQPGQAWWSYSLNDATSLVALGAILAIGMIRLDIYRIDSDARLEYVFSFGSRLPSELLDRLRDFLHSRSLPAEQVMLFHAETATDELEKMRLIEQNMFEGLAAGIAALREDPDSIYAVAFRDYLELQHNATAAAFRGFSPDTAAYMEARETLRRTHPDTNERRVEQLDIVALGPNRGYVQVRVRLDAPTTLTAHAAFIDESGKAAIVMAELSIELRIAWGPEGQATALATGLAELRVLLDHGITGVVLNVPPVAYNLPLHEAFLRIGFHEASYTHRLGSLDRPPADIGSGALVMGNSGEGSRYIRAVDVELDAVSELRGVVRSAALGHAPTGIVHLAGHGQSGYRSYEVGLDIEPGASPLSSARVLLELDASAIGLVFLSACSSGRGSFTLHQLAETVPLDVAFIEAGAACVVSTAAPVNDYVAAFFAITFHVALSERLSIWNAYFLAREATRSGSPSVQAAAALSKYWPGWEEEFAAARLQYPFDWQLFRLSGRYWA